MKMKSLLAVMAASGLVLGAGYARVSRAAQDVRGAAVMPVVDEATQLRAQIADLKRQAEALGENVDWVDDMLKVSPQENEVMALQSIVADLEGTVRWAKEKATAQAAPVAPVAAVPAALGIGAPGGPIVPAEPGAFVPAVDEATQLRAQIADLKRQAEALGENVDWVDDMLKVSPQENEVMALQSIVADLEGTVRPATEATPEELEQAAAFGESLARSF